MSTGTQTCDIVLPGYTLTGRIGSGGYAEVWRAEAPGGIEKAVKIVYGYYDDEFASQELKALERIKGVRHPFLLSLERFEILNGRLAILTELADMSLDQRRQQCRADGLPGIPREELLRYMADAAEALDFLSQRHSLLHLDIKPENLLVSGDHIKVADFGLVKELATRTQNSLVSGMTPTYAAPEVFDDAPSAFSDQYSLAIVYQEMLVGTLPFPGRTAAQLAKQHTQAEPQLNSVPAEDRSILARALAKKPTDRFPSCKAFVDALLGRAQTPPAAPSKSTPRATPPAPQPTTPETDDTKPPSFCTTLRRAPDQRLDEIDIEVTQPVRRDKAATPAPPAKTPTPPAPFVPEDIVDVQVPSVDQQLLREQPTLYLAAGGVGVQLLSRLLTLIAPNDVSEIANRPIESIALDTNRDELREACSSRKNSKLSLDDTLHLPLRLPKSYDNSREILGWVSRRWLYNIPRSLETRGFRPLGRVALVDHSQRVLGLIEQKLEKLGTLAGGTNDAGQPRDSTIKVVLLAGTGGGTGAGMAIDLANAVKAVASNLNLQVEMHGFMVCTCFATSNSSPLVAANTYSLLKELSHAATLGNEGSGDKSLRSESFEARQAPFDHVYWVPARARAAAVQPVDLLDTLAKYLALDWTPEARAALRSCRSSRTPRDHSEQSFKLRKLGYTSLADQKRSFVGQIAVGLAEAVKHYWLTNDTSANWERLVREAEQAASEAKLAPASDENPDAPRAVVPVNEAAPLALRGRFKDHKSLEFASEVLRQVQRQLESRDERGRPLLIARDAKLIADTASCSAAAFKASAEGKMEHSPPFADTAMIQSLIATASRLVISRAVDSFDPTQPERFLPADSIDDILQGECRTLLEESLTRPDSAASIEALIDMESAAAAMLDGATTDLLQCGYDRRTLLFAPQDDEPGSVVAKLQTSRPLATVIPATAGGVIVVSEESGLSPRSLAYQLERVLPGIAEAARRLHTRIDVEWEELC